MTSSLCSLCRHTSESAAFACCCTQEYQKNCLCRCSQWPHHLWCRFVVLCLRKTAHIHTVAICSTWTQGASSPVPTAGLIVTHYGRTSRDSLIHPFSPLPSYHPPGINGLSGPAEQPTSEISRYSVPWWSLRLRTFSTLACRMQLQSRLAYWP